MHNYVPKHFAIHELVPPAMHKLRGTKGFQLLDARALVSLDRLRKRYGPITVNNYHWGGDREWSGLRTPGSPYYSVTSQHSFGRAFDCLFDNHTAAEVQNDIQKWNKDGRYTAVGHTFEFITSIELGTSWLHFDTRNVHPLMVYYPNK